MSPLWISQQSMWGLVGDGEGQVVMALSSGASLAQTHVNVDLYQLVEVTRG